MTTKLSIVDRVIAEFHVSRRQANDIVDFFSNTIEGDLLAHGTALIPGIGKLKLGHRNARVGRNPRTGDQIQIAARRSVRLRPSAQLRRQLG